MNVTKKITLTVCEWEILESVLHDVAVDRADEGRQDEPDVKILWKLYRQLGEDAKS